MNDEEAAGGGAWIGTENRKEEKSEVSYKPDPAPEAAEAAGGGGRGRVAAGSSGLLGFLHFLVDSLLREVEPPVRRRKRRDVVVGFGRERPAGGGGWRLLQQLYRWPMGA